MLHEQMNRLPGGLRGEAWTNGIHANTRFRMIDRRRTREIRDGTLDRVIGRNSRVPTET